MTTKETYDEWISKAKEYKEKIASIKEPSKDEKIAQYIEVRKIDYYSTSPLREKMDKESYDKWLKIALEPKYLFDDKYKFQEAPEEIQKDYQLNMLAMVHGKESFYKLHVDIKYNREFIMEIIDKIGSHGNYVHFPDEMKKDLEIIYRAYLAQPKILTSIPWDLSRHHKVIYDLLSLDGRGYENCFSKYKEDLSYLKKAIETAPQMISEATGKQAIELCKDSNLIEHIINNNPESFKFLPKWIQKNEKWLKLGLEKSCKNIYFISDKLKNDRKFIFHLAKDCDYPHYYLPSIFLDDKEIIMMYIERKNIGNSIIPKHLWYDEEFTYKAILHNCNHYNDAPEDVRATTKAILALLTHYSHENQYDYMIPKSIKEEVGEQNMLEYMQNKYLFEQIDKKAPTKSATTKKKI